MNLLGIYTVGVARSLCRRFTTRHRIRKLSIVMALSTTFTQYAHEITKFGKNCAKWGPFRRSRSFKVTDFGTNRKLIYDFLLVINTNLPLYCIVSEIQHSKGEKIAIFRYTLLRLNPRRRGSPWTISVNFPRMSMDGQGTKWQIKIAENFNRLSRVHERHR